MKLNSNAVFATIIVVVFAFSAIGIIVGSKEETVKHQQYLDFQLDSMKIVHDTLNHFKYGKETNP